MRETWTKTHTSKYVKQKEEKWVRKTRRSQANISKDCHHEKQKDMWGVVEGIIIP